jgi:hypothetical protein
MSLATKRCRGHVSGSNPDFSYSVTKVLLNTLAGTPVKALVTTVSVSLEESKRSLYPCNAPLSRHTKKRVPIAIPEAPDVKAATATESQRQV